MGSLLGVLSTAKGLQRVPLVALALTPLLLVTISCMPAFIILPFFRGGTDRSRKLITQLAAWTRIVLVGTST